MFNHYDNETRLTAILRCVVDDTADAAMLQQLGPARTREEIFVSRALGKKPWAAIPPRTTLEMWLAFIAEDAAEPTPGSYTVRSCAESCIITYARRVKGATAIVPIFPPHSPYEIALAKLTGIIPVSYGVQGRPWELLINQLAEQGPRKNVTVIYGSTPRHEDGQIAPVQDLHGYDYPWPGGGGTNLWPDALPTNAITATCNGPVINIATNARVFAIPVNRNTSYWLQQDKLNKGWNGVAFSTKLPEVGDKIDYRGNMANRGDWVLNSGENDYMLCQVATAAAFEALASTYHALVAEGSTATAWTPYENICPITPGLDMLRDNGDRLVVWSGEINTAAGEIISRSAEIASYAGEQLSGPWISSLDAYTPGATPTIGAQVVYELPDPVIYRLTQAELQRALGCTKYLGVGAWKLCPGVVTVITAQLTTGEATTHYDLAPSVAEGWTFEISVGGQTVTGATGALSVATGEHSVIITATPATGAAACYIQPTLYSEVAP